MSGSSTVPPTVLVPECRVRQDLEVSRQTIRNWNDACGPLEDNPLTPTLADCPDHGTEKHYSSKDIEDIKSAFEYARTGEYVDRAGVAWLNTERTLAELRPVRKTLTKQTLYIWRTQGCLHREGGKTIDTRDWNLAPPRPSGQGRRGGSTHPVWHRKDHILEIKQSLQASALGKFGTPDDPYLTSEAINSTRKKQKRKPVAPHTLKRWEAQGLISAESYPSNRSGGQPPKKDRRKGDRCETRAFRNREVEATLEVAATPHDGVYEGLPEGTRLDIVAAARLLGVHENTMRYVLKRLDDTWRAKLRPEKRRPPGPGRPGFRGDELTVLKAGVLELRAARRSRRHMRKPQGRWLTDAQLLEHFGVTGIQDRVEVMRYLLSLLQSHPEIAASFPNGRTDQCQLVRHWNLDLLDPLLAAAPRQPDSSAGAESQKTHKAKRARPAREKHKKWKEQHDAGMSYGKIAHQHKHDTGEKVTREAVIMAISRLEAADTAC
jgi:hypothetical protein